MASSKAKPPPDPERQESYERFKALAEKVLGTPKSEVDKEAEAFKQRPKGGRGRPPKGK